VEHFQPFMYRFNLLVVDKADARGQLAGRFPLLNIVPDLFGERLDPAGCRPQFLLGILMVNKDEACPGVYPALDGVTLVIDFRETVLQIPDAVVMVVTGADT
jgi:hypothetical protein